MGRNVGGWVKRVNVEDEGMGKGDAIWIPF